MTLPASKRPTPALAQRPRLGPEAETAVLALADDYAARLTENAIQLAERLDGDTVSLVYVKDAAANIERGFRRASAKAEVAKTVGAMLVGSVVGQVVAALAKTGAVIFPVAAVAIYVGLSVLGTILWFLGLRDSS